MTTTTASSERRRHSRRGVTLIELMVALVLSSIALSAVMGSFLFIARSSLISTSYAGMDGEARKGLEIFARDVRMAMNVSDFSANSVKFIVPTSPTTTKEVVYTYVPAEQNFYQNYGLAGQRRLLSGVDVFIMKRYSILEDPITKQPTEATNDLETKQIQIQLHALRAGAARATATNNVISARYILRNKIVGN